MRPILLATACAAVLSTCATAAWSAESATEVGELVVVANRTPQPLDRIGQSVSVIDADAIAASQAVSIADLLTRMPGINVSRNGGPGGVTALRIRGAEGDQTAVVIDGVKVNDPSQPGGGFNFASLLTGDISRIEILRGAHSTLWGSQAIGGVVNIVTAEATQPFEASAAVEGGSMGTAYGKAAIGGAGERLNWRLAGATYVTSGVSAFGAGREKDGYRNTGFSGRGRVDLTDRVWLDLRALYTDGRNETDGFPPPFFSFGDDPSYTESEELTGYAAINLDLLDGKLTHRLAYGYSNIDRVSFDPTQAVTPVTFDATGRTRRWEYQGVWSPSEAWQVTFGAESERASMRTRSPSGFDPNPVPASAKVGVESLYAQVQGEVAPGLTLTAGLRRDRHDAYGDHSLGQVAAAWSLNEGDTVLRASYGQGFKAPTLYQLYGDFGNLTLAPEDADSWDAGVEQRFLNRAVVVTATVFQRETENQIDFVSCPFSGGGGPLCAKNGAPRFGYYANIARTKAHGVELEALAKAGPLRVEVNYTYTDARNESAGNPNRGKDLARRPRDQANISAAYLWPNRLSTILAAHYVGEAFDNATNTNRLQAYTLVDLRASYPIGERLEVYGRVENALDAAYATIRGYGVAGRGAYVGLRAKF